MSHNQLASETSPYLLQHADNPVHWYPWGEEALTLAKTQNKPILLSIGYSACHWCHVMAHESFEDADTAAVMNALFINIKVDREERPDLDKLYQTAHFMLTERSGGWPLTMFLTPDQTPFLGGTYFPKTARYGLPAFTDLMRKVSDYLQQRPDDIAKQNVSLLSALNNVYEISPSEQALSSTSLRQARDELDEQFDPQHGGFGRAPKFPHPSSLERLLRHHQQHPDDSHALHMLDFTLRKMALGGVYDQLGGGFCRYSVDDYWMIPHFEKMLYDNGPLLSMYAQTFAITQNPLFAQICTQTATWVLSDMQDKQGGFYATRDADSEGEEGKFYVWTREQVQELLGAEDYPAFAARYGLDQNPNFEGAWHLHHYAEPDTTDAALEQRLAANRQTLLAQREQRIHPGRDEKILTAWNALMIRGLCIAARACQRPDWTQAAEKALDFIQASLYKNGRLLAVHKDGESKLAAYLDDYAFLLDALLELLQNRWRASDCQFAIELAETLLTHFEDPKLGGFYFTADDHESLVQRPRSNADEAMPSGNAIAALALQRLGFLLSEPRYLDSAERALKQSSKHLQRAPSSHCSMLHVLEEHLNPPQILILRGKSASLAEWQQAVNQHYQANRLCFAIPDDAQNLPPALAAKKAQTTTVAYRCEGMSCSEPLTELAKLLTDSE